MIKLLTGRRFGDYTTILGRQEESPYYWWFGESDNFFLAPQVGPPISIDDSDPMYMSGYLYNGFSYYYYFPYYIWQSSSSSHIISHFLGGGTLLKDTYWTCDDLIGTYLPQGAATGSKTVSYAQIDGFYCETKYGVYTGIGSFAGKADRYIGWRHYIATYDSDTFSFYETPEKYNGYPVFIGESFLSYLWKSGSSYFITNKAGIASRGYWACSSIEGIYTRIWSGHGEDPYPNNVSVSFDDYKELPTQSTDQYIAQVSVYL